MIPSTPSAIERGMEGGEQPEILRHYQAGQEARLAGDLDKAAEHLFQAFELNSSSIHILLEIGLLQSQRGEWEHASHCFEQALQIQPDNPQALDAMAHACQAQGQRPEAVDYWKRAVDLQPDYVDAWQNLGLAHEHLDQLPEAITAHQQAANLRPNDSKTHRLLGMAQLDYGLLPAARKCNERALELSPNDPETIWQRFFLRALENDFPAAWVDYECRFDLPGRTTPEFTSHAPRWQGEELPGQTLLLHAEQGFGDTLQMIRYAPRCAERVGRVHVWAPKALKRLVAAAPGVATVVDHPDAFDAHLPMMSLPGVFGDSLETIPSAPYLGSANSSGPLRNLGLAWTGSGKQPLDRRSVPLEELAPLWDVPGVTWHSLQVDAKEDLEATPLRDRAGELKDFAATTEVMVELDGVVCVDSAVAHLAGALGVRSWVLLSFAPDWRWGREGNSSPWYPSLTLVRQQYGENWATVSKRLATVFH